MNTKDTDSNRSERLKREVLRDIKNVDQDVRRFEARLTPGQLIDDAIFYRRDHDPMSIFNHLKENPFGASFLALGTLLLMDDKDHRSFERTARDHLASLSQTAKMKRDQFRGRAEHLRERLTKTKEAIREKIPSREEVRADLQEIRAGAGETVTQANENLQELKESVPESIDSFTEKMDDGESPWTFLTLGAALGAMSGTVLPELPREEQILGSEKIQGFSSELKGALDEAVNLVKAEFLTDLKDLNVQLFKRPT